MRVLAIALLASCTSAGATFPCEGSTECVLAGVSGTCEPAGFCSFPDSGCVSGSRYGEFSPAELAGVCVGSEGIVDDDGDGVDDTLDNCAGVQNATQHDEDGDGLGDPCDPCPPFPDTDDDDGDGVAGRCDPDPLGANTILEFQGFDVEPPSTWITNGSGDWSFANDDALVDSEGARVGMLLRDSPAEGATLMTEAEVVGIDATGFRVVGIIDLFDVGANQGTSCVGLRDSTGDQSLLLSDTATADIYGSAPMTVAVGTTEIFTTVRDGANLTCKTATLSVGGVDVGFSPPGASLGLRARSATVRYAWALVVR